MCSGHRTVWPSLLFPLQASPPGRWDSVQGTHFTACCVELGTWWALSLSPNQSLLSSPGQPPRTSCIWNPTAECSTESQQWPLSLGTARADVGFREQPDPSGNDPDSSCSASSLAPSRTLRIGCASLRHKAAVFLRLEKGQQILKGKKAHIFCTLLLWSGFGLGILTPMLCSCHNDNIPDLTPTPLWSFKTKSA